MKVVLFCGGMGMRLREHSEALPKPIVPVGHRPIIWHVMKYYAHFGQKDFILCLGYKSAVIKEYFLRYNEAISNDFVMSEGGRNLQLLGTDIQDWTITFADTGLNSNIGQRLKAVERYLHGEEVFLANYADGLTDFPLPSMIDHFMAERKGRGLPLRATHSQLSHGLAGDRAAGGKACLHLRRGNPQLLEPGDDVALDRAPGHCRQRHRVRLDRRPDRVFLRRERHGQQQGRNQRQLAKYGSQPLHVA